MANGNSPPPRGDPTSASWLFKTHAHCDANTSYLAQIANIGKAVSLEPKRLVATRSPGVRDSFNGDDLHQVR
jgi:hypothetical protein